MEIIRYYWIAWDNSNGTDGEVTIRNREQAEKYFEKMVSLNVPYVKLVACDVQRGDYKHSDITLKTYSQERG